MLLFGYNVLELAAFILLGDLEKDKKIKNFRKVIYYFKIDDFILYYYLINWNFSRL